MNCFRTLPLFVTIIYFCSVYAWQQSDSEYNDDSLSIIPSSAWKENTDKRNTWWTKKSIQNEEAAGCTTEKCMLILMDCLRRAESKLAFLHCKDSHTSCLVNCFQKYREKFLFNTVAMAS